MGWNKFKIFSTSEIFSNTSLSENLVKFCLNYFKDKHNIKLFKFQFSNENSYAMEKDIKQYISEDEDISRILNIQVKMAFVLISIFIDMACRADIKLDWTATLHQKGFFVGRLFLFRCSIPEVEKN